MERFVRQWPALLVGSLLALGAAASAPAQTPFRPVATVNSGIITAFDVDQRARILAVLGANAGSQQQLGNIALDRLIEDRLRMQEAARAGLAKTPEIVEQGIAEFAGRLGITPDAMLSRLAEAGVTRPAIEDLVAGQMLWREVVQDRFRGRIEPGEAEIDAEIALAGTIGSVELRLREIGLPFTADGRTEAQTRALALQLYDDLRAGADFEALLRRYSRSPSAAQGGDIGWIAARDLPPVLARELTSLEPGDYAPPQELPQGITLLRLTEKRGGAGADAGDEAVREQVRRDLLARRLDLLAQGLLQELRRDALIELR